MEVRFTLRLAASSAQPYKYPDLRRVALTPAMAGEGAQAVSLLGFRWNCLSQGLLAKPPAMKSHVHKRKLTDLKGQRTPCARNEKIPETHDCPYRANTILSSGATHKTGFLHVDSLW